MLWLATVFKIFIGERGSEKKKKNKPVIDPHLGKYIAIIRKVIRELYTELVTILQYCYKLYIAFKLLMQPNIDIYPAFFKKSMDCASNSEGRFVVWKVGRFFMESQSSIQEVHVGLRIELNICNKFWTCV